MLSECSFQSIVCQVFAFHLQALRKHTNKLARFFLVPCTFLVWYSPACLINNTADSICRDSIQTPVHVGISDKNITLEDTSNFAPLSQEFTAREQCVLCD